MRPFHFLSGLFAIAACDNTTKQVDVGRPGQPVRRDSSGIEIVENAQSVWRDSALWSVSDQPLVRIGREGGLDRTQQLTAVVAAIRFADGRIAIALAAGEIRFFDASGKFINTAGRKGNGPGEFASLDFMGRMRGDTLITLDESRSRIHIFDSNGKFVNTAVVPVKAAHAPTAVGVFDDGTIFGERIGEDIPQPRKMEDGAGQNFMGYYVNVLPTGEVASEFFHRPAPVPGALPRVAPVRFNLPKTASYASFTTKLSDPGSGIVGEMNMAQPATFTFARGHTFYYADAASFEIHFSSRAGELSRIARASVAPIRIPESAKRDTAYHIVPPRGSQSRTITHPVEKVRWPEFYPHFRDLFVDSMGNVWLSRYAPDAPEKTHPWYVVDSTGAWLGDVNLPASLQLLDVGSNYILGLQVDKLGVETVAVYGLNSRAKR